MSPDYTGTDGFGQPLEGPRKRRTSGSPARVTRRNPTKFNPAMCGRTSRPHPAPGPPGVGIVAPASLQIDQLIDILAYCQTLPTK